MTCPDCEGRGEVLDAPGRVLDGRAAWTLCPTCGGTTMVVEIMRVGRYSPPPPAWAGPITITRTMVAEMFANLTGPVPVTLNFAIDQPPIGVGTHFALSPDGNALLCRVTLRDTAFAPGFILNARDAAGATIGAKLATIGVVTQRLGPDPDPEVP